MNNSNLVSVIIPIFNAEQFLQETIDSVLAQSYQNWELLLIDDGSSDGSNEIAFRYAEQFPDKVRYLEHEGHQNRGVCASRNFGISEAKGEFIALLDADDIWLPQKLEKQVALLNHNPEVGMVYGATKYWKSWTGKPEDANGDYIPKICTESNSIFKPPSHAMACYPVGKGTAPCLCSLLLRRDVITHVGGFVEEFPKAYQLYEDQAFLLKVYLSASVLVVNECWDLYRLHPESCMAKAHSENQYHVIRQYFFHWLEKYLIEHKFQESEVWNVLQKRIDFYREPNSKNPTN